MLIFLTLFAGVTIGAGDDLNDGAAVFATFCVAVGVLALVVYYKNLDIVGKFGSAQKWEIGWILTTLVVGFKMGDILADRRLW